MSFLRNKRLLLLLASLIILVALIGFSLKSDRKLTLPEQFTKDTIGFVQKIVLVPTNYVSHFFDNIQEMKNMHQENKILKSKLEEYLTISQKASELEQENEELRAVLGKTEEDDLSKYTEIQATVISRNPDQWYDTVTINKGSTDGITKDMAVMTASGLVGRVKSVSKFTSTVQLLSDVNRTNRIPASIQSDSKVFGLVEGYDESGEYLLFKKIPSDTEIKKDQIVVTSGLSGIFPSNLVIGTVEKVEVDEFGLSKTAYVKPAADFYDINNVIVVDRVAETAEEEE